MGEVEMIEGGIEAETGGWRPDLGLLQGEVEDLGDLFHPSEGWEMCTVSFTSATLDPHPLICLSPQRKGMLGPSFVCNSARDAGLGMLRTSFPVWARSEMLSLLFATRQGGSRESLMSS